jgi:hypothetical protein
MQKTPRELLLETYRRVLRPLIRILIRADVRYDEVLELIKRVYVESAVRDGLGDGIALTRARVSITTGVSRRDVDRIIDKEDDIPPIGKTMTRTLMEILHKWHTDPQFVGPYGIPLELEMNAPRGRSFRELSNFVNPLVSPNDAINELVRLRAVVVSGDSHYRAVARALKPVEEMSPAQLEFFGNALTRLADTVRFNIDPQNSTKRLEQSVISDHGLPKEKVPEFEKYAREKVMDLLFDLDNWLSPYSTKDNPHTEPAERVGVAVFQFVDRPPDRQPMKDKVVPDAN